MRKEIAGLVLLLAASSVSAASLVIGLGGEVTSIDPHALSAVPNSNIAEHIFDRLVHRDAQLQLRPGLAESWRTLDDRTWEFKLRKAIKLHDGSEFTAHDVAYTVTRAASIPTGGYSVFTRMIEQTTVVDSFTVRFRTVTPYPNLARDMSLLHMVPRKAGQNVRSSDFDSGKSAIGAGPYKLVRFAKGDRIEMVRHEAYWGPKPPWDYVTFRLIKSDPSRVAALLAGEVQIIDAIPPQDYVKLRGNGDLAVFNTTSYRVIFFHLDSSRDRSPFVTDTSGKPLDRNPLKDVRVRRAISKAINRQAIVKRVMDGLALPAGQFLPDGFFGFAPGLKPEAYDPDGARKLLADAGYPDGFGLTLHGPNNGYVNDEQVVQAVAQMLQKIGVATRVETLPFSVYITRGRRFEFSAALLGWGTSTGEGSYPLISLVATVDATKGQGTWNWSNYSNPKMDGLIARALATPDNARREKLLQDAAEIAVRDQAVIPLYYQVNTWATRRGYTYVPRIDERTYAFDVKKQ